MKTQFIVMVKNLTHSTMWTLVLHKFQLRECGKKSHIIEIDQLKKWAKEHNAQNGLSARFEPHLFISCVCNELIYNDLFLSD